jgi:AbrB family looped-hinge helix DNA binding protein
MKSTISSKGQITVPAEVRAALGLRPGTRVLFELQPGGVLLRKGSGRSHPVDEVFGRVQLEAPVDRLLDQARGAAPSVRRTRRRHR